MAEPAHGSSPAEHDALGTVIAMPPPTPSLRVTRPLPLNLSRVAAPMVRQSDLPFRRLVRARGASLAVTQMYVAAELLADAGAMARALATCAADDGPVVAQLAGDDPGALLAAARALAPHVDGVDLNLGCPQERARQGHYGAYLAGPGRRDWPTVAACVSALVAGLAPLPVSAKVRLQDDLPGTLDFARLLAGAGVAWVGVHGRTRGSAARRRAGPARLEWVRAIVDELRPAGVPVVTNGNVRCHGDVHAALAATGAAGVMAGEGLLEHPGLFDCAAAAAAAAAATADGGGSTHEGAAAACAVTACGCEWDADHHVGPRAATRGTTPTATAATSCCCRPDVRATVATIHAYLAEVEALPPGHGARPPPDDVAQHVSWMLGRRGRGPSLHYARLLPVIAAAAAAAAAGDVAPTTPANLALARHGPALKAALFAASAASETAAAGGSYDALRAVVDSLLPVAPSSDASI